MKKRINYLLFGLLFFFFSFKNCFAAELICSNSGVLKAFRIGGIIILILKIIAPLAIIITGIISFTKAILNEDDGDIKKCAMILLQKFFVGALIFIIPTIANSFLLSKKSSDSFIGGYKDCSLCLVNIKTCNYHIRIAELEEQREIDEYDSDNSSHARRSGHQR